MSLTGNELVQIQGLNSDNTLSGQATLVSASSIAALAPLLSVNSSYFFHGFAGGQIIGDTKFFDKSGYNHGNFGANLSNASAWASSGYVSSVAPSGGNNNGAIRMPAVNFDYQAGEKLILWWLGIVTAPGSTASFMGDGFGVTYPGTRIRANTDGTFDVGLSPYSGSSAFTGSSTGAPFDGTLHSFAIMFDGSAKQYGFWVDEVFDTAFVNAYSTFNSGNTVDTRSTNTFNVGQSAPAVANSTDGIASKTRALAIFRLAASTTTPSIPVLTTLFSQLRANPEWLANGSVF